MVRLSSNGSQNQLLTVDDEPEPFGFDGLPEDDPDDVPDDGVPDGVLPAEALPEVERIDLRLSAMARPT